MKNPFASGGKMFFGCAVEGDGLITEGLKDKDAHIPKVIKNHE